METRQIGRLQALRGERDSRKVAAVLETVGAAAGGGANIMPVLIDAVKAYATVGEISDVLRDVFGEYRERTTL